MPGDVPIDGRSTLLLSLVTALAALSSPALAQSAPEAAPLGAVAQPSPPTETYSAQILAADFGGIMAAGALAGVSNQPALLLVTPLAAPAVHGLHGHWGRAFGSLMLNVSLPVAGMAIGGLIDGQNCGGEAFLCGLEGIALGGLAGIASAIVIDAGVLARLPDEAPAGERTAATPAVTPLFALGRDGGLSLGLGGRF